MHWLTFFHVQSITPIIDVHTMESVAHIECRSSNMSTHLGLLTREVLFDIQVRESFCLLNSLDPSESKEIPHTFSHQGGKGTHLWELHQGKGWGLSSKWNICGQLTLQKVGLNKLYQEGSVCWQFDKSTCCLCFTRREVRRYTRAPNETLGYCVAIHSQLSQWWMRS